MDESHDRSRPSSATSAPGLPTSQFCIHLQSKKTFFLRGLPLSEDDILDASRHCWCRKTMQAIGPDGELVDPDTCQPGRVCHEPAAG